MKETCPEADMIESYCEGDNVGSNLSLVLLVPGTTLKFLGQNLSEHCKLNQ